MEQNARVHLLISGMVQGVLYRRNAQKKAQELGITGWARNLKDGRVECVCEGERAALREFVEWAKKGPPLALVRGVEIEESPWQGEFSGFQIRETE